MGVVIIAETIVSITTIRPIVGICWRKKSVGPNNCFRISCSIRRDGINQTNQQETYSAMKRVDKVWLCT